MLFHDWRLQCGNFVLYVMVNSTLSIWFFVPDPLLSVLHVAMNHRNLLEIASMFRVH